MSSTSPLWTASAKRPTSRRSPAEFGRGARSRSAAGSRASERRAGALQGALDRGLARVEHLGDLGGAEAEHVASTSAARWRGGRCCRATMNESSIDSLAS